MQRRKVIESEKEEKLLSKNNFGQMGGADLIEFLNAYIAVRLCS